MASWNSQTFGERPTGSGTWAAWVRELIYTTHQLPGSDNQVTIVSGKGPRKLDLPIKASESVMDSLVGAVGSTSTLVTEDDSRSALLISVTDLQEIANSGQYFATLHFVEA